MVKNKVMLPSELIEDMLSYVPPKSLARFRIVSKQWNALFQDKKFLNNHKATFRFILATKSKFYSVSIDPKIVVSELALDIPGLADQKPKNLVDCDEFLVCAMNKGAAVLNPWFRQTRWIEANHLSFDGIGYDNTRKNEKHVYKSLASFPDTLEPSILSWKLHDFASDVWKDYHEDKFSDSSEGGNGLEIIHSNCLSLNGTLYMVASFKYKPDSMFHLLSFDFAKEKFFKFCDLPCRKNHNYRDALVLGVFKGDRFSLLKQCHLTKKIEIWVTKNQIVDRNLCGNVEWMNFMEVSIPNFPDLVLSKYNSKPSYFIEDRKLVVCSCDETGRAWIYVVRENQLISKVQLDSVVDPWPLHCTYFPSLVPVPRGKREEAEL